MTICQFLVGVDKYEAMKAIFWHHYKVSVIVIVIETVLRESDEGTIVYITSADTYVNRV